MNHVLDRHQFERLILCSGCEVPDAIRRRLVDERYPANTASAAAELRQRGVDADEALLNRAVASDKIPLTRAGSGTRLKWHAADIDRALEILAGEGRLTPASACSLHLGVALADLIAAQHRARHNYPDVDVATLVLEIAPSGAGRHEARYRPMDADEMTRHALNCDDADKARAEELSTR